MEVNANIRHLDALGRRIACGVITVLTLAALPASAMVTFFGTGNGNDEVLSASVSFDLAVSGTATQLVVTLSNTGSYNPNDSADILTGVFFFLPADVLLTRVSARLASGSTLFYQGAVTNEASGDVVGGEWAYKSGLAGAPSGANQGISSAGLGWFGPADVFPGPDLGTKEGAPPSGVAWGLTTTNDNARAYNGGLAGRGYIKNSVVFTLGNVPASLDPLQISHVSFQYGTALYEPNLIGIVIPEPSTFALAFGGLLTTILLGQRRRVYRV
jgi:hypothetical protein